jgi:hypothetical protein
MTVYKTARASSNTKMGVPYFCHLGVAFATPCFSSAGASAGGTGTGFGTESGAAEDERSINIKLLYSGNLRAITMPKLIDALVAQ